MSARPWDPDVTRRVAYTVTKLAETSQADITYVLEPLEAACNSLPGSVECQLTLSSARDVTGDHARALAAADAALTFDPTNVDAHLARGIALAGLSRYNDSEASFLEASRLRPTASEPWSDLAHLYTLMGRTADSQAAKAKADALAKR
jgi:Flp pilus assembly protein TadD